jgi:hypothetical protein
MATRMADGTQLRLPYLSGARAGGAAVSVPGVAAPVVFVRRRRARHYILRLRDDGVVRVTVPWHGSRAEAERFLVSRREWVDRERHRRQLALAATEVAPELRAHLRTRAAGSFLRACSNWRAPTASPWRP